MLSSISSNSSYNQASQIPSNLSYYQASLPVCHAVKHLFQFVLQSSIPNLLQFVMLSSISNGNPLQLESPPIRPTIKHPLQFALLLSISNHNVPNCNPNWISIKPFTSTCFFYLLLQSLFSDLVGVSLQFVLLPSISNLLQLILIPSISNHNVPNSNPNWISIKPFTSTCFYMLLQGL